MQISEQKMFVINLSSDEFRDLTNALCDIIELIDTNIDLDKGQTQVVNCVGEFYGMLTNA